MNTLWSSARSTLSRPCSVTSRKMAAQLVELPEVERLSPAVVRILGGNPDKFTLQGTNTYLLGTGPSRLLIDSGQGMPSWIAALKRTLADEGGVKISTALLSHWHHDHIEGVSDLLALSPETQVYKFDLSAGQGVNPEGWHEMADGQTFTVEGATLKAVHTPGHTTDHIAFVLEEEDALFTGDNVLGQGTAVFEDLATYLSSLEKMGTLVAGRGYPGHGPVLEDARGKIAEYISHRKQREAQVVQTLASAKNGGGGGSGSTGELASWTPMELVKVIYKDYPESLHLPATGSVAQILKKLQSEDRVTAEGESWRLRDRSSL